jgi:hypothetical protein
MKTFLTSILILLSLSIFAESYNAFQFGQFLYEKKEYDRAASEFLKYSFLQKESVIQDSILIEVAKCKNALLDYDSALHYLKQVTPKNVQLWNLAQQQIFLAYHKKEEFQASIDHFSQLKQPLKNDILLYQSANFAMLGNWKKAEQISNNYGGSKDISSFKEILQQGKNFKPKSKFIGTLSSILIPGMGKIYVDKWKDAQYSFILIGLAGWQSYEGFRKDGITSFRGWFSGTMFCTFYAGNIYGSYVEVKIYNEKYQKELQQKLLLELKF